MFLSLNEAERHALLLSTLAGLSTSIGGAIAVRALKVTGPPHECENAQGMSAYAVMGP